MTNRNKEKGKSAERECAKILAEHFGGSWTRTWGSGNFVGGANIWRAQKLSESQLLNNANDLVPPDEFSHVAVECKAYKDFEFHHLYRSEGNITLNKWIDQVEDSGISLEKDFPMICFKPNRKGWFICVWADKVSEFNFANLNYTVYKKGDKRYVITDFIEFIQQNKENLETKWKG